MLNLRDFKKRHVGAAKKAAASVRAGLLTRAEWERRDPNGWERASYAESGIEVEYADDPHGEEPIRGVSPLQFAPRKRDVRDGQPSVLAARPLAQPPRPPRFRALRHLARCSNCGSQTCGNAKAKADWTCIHWTPARGTTVTWNDYEVVK